MEKLLDGKASINFHGSMSTSINFNRSKSTSKSLPWKLVEISMQVGLLPFTSSLFPFPSMEVGGIFHGSRSNEFRGLLRNVRGNMWRYIGVY